MNTITISTIINIMISIVIAVMTSLTFYYHHEFRTVSDKYLITQHDVIVQNQTAKAQLDVLTKDRDEKQKKINQQAVDQGKKDESAKKQIAVLATQLHNQPIRVRVISANRQDHNSASSSPSSASIDSAANFAATSWILPQSNSDRLGSAITEIETMSAAYSSCRATLIMSN
jgi:uncharacterized protein YxeA